MGPGWFVGLEDEEAPGLPFYQLKGLGLWLLDLLITFNPSAVFLSGRWPANIHHSGPEGGDGFVFLALFCSFASPVVSPWKQVQPLCCLCFGQIDAYWGFFFAVYPPPLPNLASKGEGAAVQGLTGALWGPGAPGVGESTVSPLAWDFEAWGLAWPPLWGCDTCTMRQSDGGERTVVCRHSALRGPLCSQRQLLAAGASGQDG